MYISLILLLWPMLPRLIELYLWYLWLILHLKYVLIVMKVSIYLPSSQQTVDAEFHNGALILYVAMYQVSATVVKSLV